MPYLSSSAVWGAYRHLLPCPAFMGAGHPNLGAHASTESFLPPPPPHSLSPALGVSLNPLPLFLLPLLSSISHLLFTYLGTSTLAPFSCHAYTFSLINGLSCQDSSWALGSVKFRTRAIHAPMVGLEKHAGQVPVGKDLWLSSLPATPSEPSQSWHTYCLWAQW